MAALQTYGLVVGFVAGMAVNAAGASEKEHQKRLCAGMELEKWTKQHTRVDCLSDEFAIEVDFSDSWADAIGQSLHYAHEFGRKAGIILICKDTVKCTAHGYRLESTIKAFNLPITVWYCRTFDETLGDCVRD